MMTAYDKTYLNKSQKNMANLLDLAINYYHLDMIDFFDRFINSNISKKIETGDSKTISGSSAYEILLLIYDNDKRLQKAPIYKNIKKSKEYWLGKSLCYYQWYKDISFKHIIENIGIKKLLSMYKKYHEMDILHFVDKLDEILFNKNNTSKLKQKRESLNISQRELSNLSGVSYRTIQQYEQKQKNINNASTSVVLALSKTLKCDIRDILE